MNGQADWRMNEWLGGGMDGWKSYLPLWVPIHMVGSTLLIFCVLSLVISLSSDSKDLPWALRSEGGLLTPGAGVGLALAERGAAGLPSARRTIGCGSSLDTTAQWESSSGRQIWHQHHQVYPGYLHKRVVKTITDLTVTKYEPKNVKCFYCYILATHVFYIFRDTTQIWSIVNYETPKPKYDQWLHIRHHRKPKYDLWLHIWHHRNPKYDRWLHIRHHRNPKYDWWLHIRQHLKPTNDQWLLMKHQ